MATSDVHVVRRPRPRSMSVSALSPAPPAVLSFKELQRRHAMQMEYFGFAGWLASALLYGVCAPAHSYDAAGHDEDSPPPPCMAACMLSGSALPGVGVPAG